MRIPLVDLKAQYANIKPEIDAAIQRVISNTAFILGKEVADFEQAFAAAVGAKGAVGVASGTAALQLALLAVGGKPGVEEKKKGPTFFATPQPKIKIRPAPRFLFIHPS